MANDAVLQKPPRLLDTQAGAYDWREFDRWIRRVYDLLAIRSDSSTYSVVSELDAIRALGYMSSSNSTTDTADPIPLVYSVGNATASTIIPDENSALSVVYSSGNTNSTTAPSDDYLTLYWMGV